MGSRYLRAKLFSVGVLLTASAGWGATPLPLKLAVYNEFLQTRRVTQLVADIPATELFYVQETDGCAAELTFSVRVSAVSGVVVFRDRFRRRFVLNNPDCAPPPGRHYRALLELPLLPGRYALDVDITETATGRFVWRHVAVEVPRSHPTKAQLGDIVLLEHDAKTPRAGDVLPAGTDTLWFALDLLGRKSTALALRVNLFRRARAELGAAAVPYQSVYQRTQAVLMGLAASKRVRLALPLADYESGEYLLEVYALSEGRVVAEQSRAFTLRWRGLPGVYTELPQSIRWLRPVAPAVRVDSLLALAPPAQRAAFEAFWVRRAEDLETDPTQALEDYYKRVVQARSRFADGLPNQLSDRAQTWLTYGEPRRRRTVQVGGQTYEVWVYPRYGYTAAFLRQGRTYLQVLG